MNRVMSRSDWVIAGSLRPIVARNFSSLGMRLKTMKAVTPIAMMNTSGGIEEGREHAGLQPPGVFQAFGRAEQDRLQMARLLADANQLHDHLREAVMLAHGVGQAAPSSIRPATSYQMRPIDALRSEFGHRVERIQERQSAAEHDGHLPQADFDIDAPRRQPVPRADGGQQVGPRGRRQVVADVEQQPAAAVDFMHRRGIGRGRQRPLLRPAGGIADFEGKAGHGGKDEG